MCDEVGDESMMEMCNNYCKYNFLSELWNIGNMILNYSQRVVGGIWTFRYDILSSLIKFYSLFLHSGEPLF
jgi:hypothetical protein